MAKGMREGAVRVVGEWQEVWQGEWQKVLPGECLWVGGVARVAGEDKARKVPEGVTGDWQEECQGDWQKAYEESGRRCGKVGGRR